MHSFAAIHVVQGLSVDGVQSCIGCVYVICLAAWGRRGAQEVHSVFRACVQPCPPMLAANTVCAVVLRFLFQKRQEDIALPVRQHWQKQLRGRRKACSATAAFPLLVSTCFGRAIVCVVLRYVICV